MQPDDEDDDLPAITAIRIFPGRISEAQMAMIEPVDSLETSPVGGVELTIVLDWEGGRGKHRLEFQVGLDERHGGEVDTDKTHRAVFRIASMKASGVTEESPKSYPIYFWWDGVPAGQRYLTVYRRRSSA